jgi:hypothetical protein
MINSLTNVACSEFDLDITYNISSVSELTSLLMNTFLNNIANVTNSVIYQFFIEQFNFSLQLRVQKTLSHVYGSVTNSIRFWIG